MLSNHCNSRARFIVVVGNQTVNTRVVQFTDNMSEILMLPGTTSKLLTVQVVETISLYMILGCDGGCGMLWVLSEGPGRCVYVHVMLTLDVLKITGVCWTK